MESDDGVPPKGKEPRSSAAAPGGGPRDAAEPVPAGVGSAAWSQAAQAAFFGCALGDLGGLLGVPAALAPPAPSAVVLHEAWPWADPVSAILRFGGWSHEDVVFDAGAAARFGALWDIWQAVQSLAAERDRRSQLEAIRWWRRQGCPVPCPSCGAIESCSCR